MKEFDDRLATAAAARLTSLLAARTTGAPVVANPAAARLPAGLDRVAARLATETPDQLQTLAVDPRTAADVLRSELPDLHFGTRNHWLMDRQGLAGRLSAGWFLAACTGRCRTASTATWATDAFLK